MPYVDSEGASFNVDSHTAAKDYFICWSRGLMYSNLVFLYLNWRVRVFVLVSFLFDMYTVKFWCYAINKVKLSSNIFI